MSDINDFSSLRRPFATVKSATVTVCAFDKNGRHEFPLTAWERFIFPTKEAADAAFEQMAQEMTEAGSV